jgi:outer membrane murein-binding lipoprotein Lpp
MAMSSPAVQDGLNRVQKLSQQLDTTGVTATALSASTSSLATDIQSLATNVKELREELGDLEGDRTLVREAIGAAAIMSALILLVLAAGLFTIARAVRTRQIPSQAPGARDSA